MGKMDLKDTTGFWLVGFEERVCTTYLNYS